MNSTSAALPWLRFAPVAQAQQLAVDCVELASAAPFSTVGQLQPQQDGNISTGQFVEAAVQVDRSTNTIPARTGTTSGDRLTVVWMSQRNTSGEVVLSGAGHREVDV